jgi:hypothetical protein
LRESVSTSSVTGVIGMAVDAGAVLGDKTWDGY